MNHAHYTQIIPYRSPGFAVGWGTLVMLNASIAESKGKSPYLWSFISMLGGPFVTFYLVYIAKTPFVYHPPRQ